MKTLVNTKTRRPVAVGEHVSAFRGETYILRGSEAPRTAASSGRVYVSYLLGNGAYSKDEDSFYPAVFGLEFAEVEEVAQ